MFTKTKVVLATTLLAATSTVALAEYDFNLANRYPSYADPIINGKQVHGPLQSAPVQLYSGGNVANSGRELQTYTGRQDPTEVDRSDHASSPYAGGAG